MKAILVALVLCLTVVSASYEGFKVVRAYVENEKQMAEINTWELDVWSGDSVLYIGWNDMVVNDNHMIELLKLEVSFNILIDDLKAHLDEGQQDLEESRLNKDATMVNFFNAYHTYDEYAAYLQNLTQYYPDISKYTPSIGSSIQGNNIFAVTVGTGSNKIFISGGQHAREWIAPATTTYILTQLITLYDTDDVVKDLLDSTTFFFVPLVNPDGYIWSWGGASQRLWRKNRRLNTGGSYGVDLNRNWNDHWGGEGSSHTPTSDTYCGTAPFSEPESKAVSAYVTENGPYKGAIDYHSYSPSLWLDNCTPSQ